MCGGFGVESMCVEKGGPVLCVEVVHVCGER